MRYWHAIALIAATLGLIGPAAAADKVNMTFSFGKAGKDAGVYVALEKGYFAEAGIDLSITAGSGSGVAVTNVVTGNSQFGGTDFGSIIAARAKGAKVRSVMLMFDHSALAVASLKNKLVLTSPKSFEGHSIAAPLGSAIRVQLPVLMRLNGVDQSKVKLVHVPGSAFIQTLFRGEVDITSAFINESGVPLKIEAAKAGKELSWLRFRDYGLDTYTMTIVTSDRLIEQNPDLVRRMVGALVKGYTFMAEHPEEAAQIMLKREPELPADVVRGQVAGTVELAKSATFAEHGYGFADPGKLRSTIAATAEAMGLSQPPSPEQIHTNEFLPGK